MMFNVVCFKEEELFVAHCLELNIATSAETIGEVKNDISDLIKAQIEYAIGHNNMEYLFKSAPQEIWNILKHSKPDLEDTIDDIDVDLDDTRISASLNLTCALAF